MGSRVPRPRPDAIYAELYTAVSDLAKSADGAVKRMTLRAELTATIVDTAKATQAAEALRAAASPTDLAKSADSAETRMALRAQIAAALENATKATQATEALIAAARSTEIAEQKPVVPSDAPATTLVPEATRPQEAVDDLAPQRDAEDRVPPILQLYDELGGFARH